MFDIIENEREGGWREVGEIVVVRLCEMLVIWDGEQDSQYGRCLCEDMVMLPGFSENLWGHKHAVGNETLRDAIFCKASYAMNSSTHVPKL